MQVKGLACVALASWVLAGCGIFGGDGEDKEILEARAVSLGVNGYLWQATFDTLHFMPIASADQNTATIITDWHSVPENPNERIKLTIRVLAADLRSDAIKVIVVRQARQNGVWVAADVQASTGLKIEEAILTQARRLRVKRLGQ